MHRFTSRTFLRYIAVQIPGWLLLLVLVLLLRSRIEISGGVIVILLGIAVVKDLLLYPLVRRAYEGGLPSGAERLVGAQGVVETPLAPKGYVRVRGELWRAESHPGTGPLPEGSTVRITAGRGMTLTVERD